MAYGEKTILPAGERTADGEGPLVETNTGGLFRLGPSMGEDARFYINVTASGGTSPTLDVDIVTEIDGIEFVLGSFAQLSAGGKETITIPSCPQNVKAKYVIGGSAGQTFTFSVHCSRV